MTRVPRPAPGIAAPAPCPVCGFSRDSNGLPPRTADLLTPGEAARRLGVAPPTLKRWETEGRLPAGMVERVPNGSRMDRRYRAGAVAALAAARGTRPAPGGTWWLTAAQVAAMAGVTAKTVGEWARTGLLPCAQTPSGRRRYREPDVRAALGLDGGTP
jgi:DNA-binding transcriptional MerR regulator